jgi:hypothetical protein
MSPELLTSRNTIAGILKAGEEALLLQHWDLGSEVQRIKQNPDQFGENSVEKVAQSLAMDGFSYLKPTRLYDAMEMVECWPDRAQIEQFAVEGLLTVQHLTELKRIASSKDRNKMLKRVVDKRLSAIQVRNEIRGDGVGMNRKSTGNTGRPVKKPSSTAAGLKQMSLFIQKGQNLNTAIWVGYVLSRLDKMSDTSVTEKLAGDVSQLVLDMEEYINDSRTTLDRLRKLDLRFRKLVGGNETTGGKSKASKIPAKAGKKKAGAAA